MIYKALLHDLKIINSIIGEYKIPQETRALFETWYNKIPGRHRGLRDSRLHGNLNRLHIMALKTSMALQASENNTLILTPDKMGQAIDFVEEVFSATSNAFGGSGLSRLGPMTEAVRQQIKVLGETTMKELMQMNYTNVTKNELEEILQALEIMEEIERPINTSGPIDQIVRNIKKKRT